MDRQELIDQCKSKYALLGTRTGQFLHAGYPSGSFIFCGARVSRVTEFSAVADKTLCNKCFPVGSPMREAFTR
jgi:hypothetical protein